MTDTTVRAWQTVWRDGIAPSLSTAGLLALGKALRDDDKRLTQQSTTTPPPLMCVQDWPIEAACDIGFCGWYGEGLGTVGEVEAYFARVCYECDQRLGEPAACRWFINWYDETPRDEMRRDLFLEVKAELQRRKSQDTATVMVLFKDGKSGWFVPNYYQGACMKGDPTAYVYRGEQLVWVKPGESVQFVEA